ncbi:MATE family efflux transporter, partial [Crocinitomicaceae bacterium]|nr:MATE family efflux transporter [Crocinitomicaceae bacterium]
MLDIKYRTILSVAIPLMGTSFIQSIVMITDSAFLSRYSITAFDAAGNGGLIYITVFIALMGMSDGAQIIMARRIGEKKENLIAQVFGTTLITNFLISLLLFCAIYLFIPDLINGITKHHDIAKGEIDFIQIRSYGLFFSMISLTIYAYFIAQGKTYVVFLSAVAIALANLTLDYALIFGNLGFPSLGLQGAALASTISDGLGMLLALAILTFGNSRKHHKIFSEIKFNLESIRRLVGVGGPIMLQGLVALITWTAFFVWIEQMGKYELTISQNIRSLYFIAFVPIWGFAGTTKTYISQYTGLNAYTKIKIVQRRILLLTFVFLILLFHGAILYPKHLVELINPNTEYIQASAEILRFIFGSILIYGLGNVFFQTINGGGNTKFT